MICERFCLRPSDLVDANNDLYDNEKIHLDFLTAIARSEEASTTMDVNSPEYAEHLERMKRTKGVKNRDLL